MIIKELEILTSKLEEQTTFYTKTLDLDIVDQTNNSTSFKIGHSILKLKQSEKFTPYHYAINIPSNQENEALAWLKERVDVLLYDNHEIQYFDFWNAYAIYFYDKDNNIVELIARRSLEHHSTESFSRKSLLEICEIGLPTDNIRRDFDILHEETNIPLHSGNVERFCAAGGEHGLFIMINKEVKKEWFPTQDEPFSSDFRIVFIEGGKEYVFDYVDERLILIPK
ncbi:MAG: VOC family protein [Saprospiraceae bacterium]